MKTFLYLFLYFLILLVFNTDGQNQQPTDEFCKMSGANVSRAFIIHNDIYFGDDESYWKMNVQDFQISDKQKIGQIFGENISLLIITTAIHFEQIPSNSKANDLVLIVGSITRKGNSRKFGYKGYKADSNLGSITAIEDDSKMPWRLAIQATLFGGNFWPQDVDSYEGMTFDETTRTIFMAAFSASDGSKLYSRKIDDNGELEPNFVPMEASKNYTALIDWKGKVYGLSDGVFYLLESGNVLTENGNFSVKQFFNCDGNSPLNEIKPTNETQTNTDIEVGSEEPQESERPDNEDKEPVSNPVPQSTTTKKPDSKSNWIIWVIIIVIIVAVIVAIILCLFCCKKSGATAAQDTESQKSKPDSKIVSEGGSRVETTRSSGSAGTAVTPAGSGESASLKKDSRSSSGESSGGSKALRKPSSKSDIESVVSVRSKAD